MPGSELGLPAMKEDKVESTVEGRARLWGVTASPQSVSPSNVSCKQG